MLVLVLLSVNTRVFKGFQPTGVSVGYSVPFNKRRRSKNLKKRKDALAEIEETKKEYSEDALFPDGSPGANEEVMFDEMRRKRN